MKTVNINKVAKEDFLTYATSVITSRAIPTVVDNLKPIHKRILYGMYLSKLTSNKNTKKSAAVVGDVMGKFHPHGDASIYGAMIRLGQEWKMRYPLVTVQGNAGNNSGDGPAAMRYTEVKLSPIGDLMVEELKYNCVPMKENYDGEHFEPTILPGMFPNILCNGNLGIAVGMSSSIVPHNLTESVDAIINYIDVPGITVQDLMVHIKGPDFPTGGVILNANDLEEIYLTGKGSIQLRAKYDIETVGNKAHIVITEIPYLTTLEKIIDQLKVLVIDEKFDDIDDIQNITNFENGINMRIILKPKVNVNRALKTIFDKTSFKTTVRVNNNAIVNGKPVVLNLKGLIIQYVNHRHQIIISINEGLLKKAEARVHIVDGLIIATQDIDGVIELVKQSSNKAEARTGLMQKYKLSEIQANAILDMKISQINKLETTKLENEQNDLKLRIKTLKNIISNKETRDEIIKDNLIEMNKKFGDARRTVIDKVSMNTINSNRKLRFLLHDNNEVTVNSVEILEIQSKGRKGKKLTDKTILQGLYVNTNELLIAFDDAGRSYKVNPSVFDEEATTYLSDIDTRINNDIIYMTTLTEKDMKKEFLVFVTKNGTVKKTLLSEYKEFKSTNYAIKLKEKDSILYVGAANDKDNVIIVGEEKVLRFAVSDIKVTGRHTIGTKGIDSKVINGAVVVADNEKILTYTDEGKGKISIAKEYNLGTRGSKGQIAGENIYGINKIRNEFITLLGENNYHINLKSTDIPKKNIKSNGIKIYIAKISTIIS